MLCRQELNSSTLTEALQRCYNNPNYDLGILFDLMSRKKDFINTMHQLMENGNVPGTKMSQDYGNDDTYIRFVNGSKIEVISCSAKTRGRRYHELLTDIDDITEDEQRVIGTMIKSYMYSEDDIEDDSEELDSFLNEFAVR